MTYENLGNFPKDFELERRVGKPVGVIGDSKKLMLKHYVMFKEGQPFSLDSQCIAFLYKEIRQNRIAPFSGLGFSILSEGILNVARWDVAIPELIKNRVYTFEGEFEEVKRVDIGEVGSFCLWELGIVAHEVHAWKKYLSSARTEEDKDLYLRSTRPRASL